MASVPYQKLPGIGDRYLGYLAAGAHACRLYVGPDHLLAMNAAGWTEEYKRFYFADIQAIVCRRTSRGRVINIVLGLLSLLLALLPFMIPNDPVALYFALAVGSPMVVIILVNTFAGPTCKVWVKTAVQTEELPSLKRLRPYLKVVAVVEPLLRAAQSLAAGNPTPATAEPLPAVSAAAPAPETNPAT